MRNQLIVLILPLMLMLVTGCRSTLYLDSKRASQPFHGGAQPVYVTNPQLSQEFEILKGAGIYSLTDRPEGARQLTLHPLHQYPYCANPLIFSGLTLGIIPGFVPGNKYFEYDVEADGKVERFSHRLPVYQRVSIWEYLVKPHDQEVLTKALEVSRREERSTTKLGTVSP